MSSRTTLLSRDCWLDKIFLVIRNLHDREALQLALIENLQRENLNPVEETEGILQQLSLRLDTAVKQVMALPDVGVHQINNVITQLEAELVKEVFANRGLMS